MLVRWIRRVMLVVLLLAVGSVLLITRGCTEIPETFVGSGPSMEPAVLPGEYFTVTSPVGELGRGMLVVFRFTHEDTVYHVLRRLAALPHDTIAMRAGQAIVNGRPMDWPFQILEPRASHSLMAEVPDLYNWGPLVVPEGSVYLLSDTRDMVGWPDSRFIGPVRVDLLESRAGRFLWARRGRMFSRLR